MVEKTWPRLWERARSLRSATKERGMRVPGFGESKAYICDEDAEQPLRSSWGAALFPVSYYLSRGVHSDKRCHNEQSSRLTNKTTEIYLHLLCLTKCLLVKYNNLAE